MEFKRCWAPLVAGCLLANIGLSTAARAADSPWLKQKQPGNAALTRRLRKHMQNYQGMPPKLLWNKTREFRAKAPVAETLAFINKLNTTSKRLALIHAWILQNSREFKINKLPTVRPALAEFGLGNRLLIDTDGNIKVGVIEDVWQAMGDEQVVDWGIRSANHSNLGANGKSISPSDLNKALNQTVGDILRNMVRVDDFSGST